MFTRLYSTKENTETIKLHTNQTEVKKKYGTKEIFVNKQGFKLSDVYRHAFLVEGLSLITEVEHNGDI
jgi:hypothetical protein